MAVLHHVYMYVCVCFSGVYGDVTRVKVLYNKRDSALIQFKEPHQSQTGTVTHCNIWVCGWGGAMELELRSCTSLTTQYVCSERVSFPYCIQCTCMCIIVL